MFCLKLSEIHFKISRDLKERISETAEMQKKLEKQLPALDKVNKGGISEWHLLLYYNAPQDSEYFGTSALLESFKKGDFGDRLPGGPAG